MSKRTPYKVLAELVEVLNHENETLHGKCRFLEQEAIRKADRYVEIERQALLATTFQRQMREAFSQIEQMHHALDGLPKTITLLRAVAQEYQRVIKSIPQ